VVHMFRVLTKQDLKASTEILRPNEQGSSSIKLSWIWQTGRYLLFQPNDGNGAGRSDAVQANGSEAGPSGREPGPNDTNDTNADPATLLECTSMVGPVFNRAYLLHSQTCSLVTGPGSQPAMA
jgi:hypothetical protein